MINLILILFTIGVFWGGFKCGNKFATLKQMGCLLLEKVFGIKATA